MSVVDDNRQKYSSYLIRRIENQFQIQVITF